MLKIKYSNYKADEDTLLDYEDRRAEVLFELRQTLPWDMTPENKRKLDKEYSHLGNKIRALKAKLGMDTHTSIYNGAWIY
jgi:hypothetical protein